jgi:hypothetical protein
VDNGSYRLVLEAEHGIRTETEPRRVTVRPDQPPQVVKFNGKDDGKTILPYDRVPLELVVADDIGVARVDLEYAVNDREPRIEPLKFSNTTRQLVTATHVLQLGGKVQEGDAVSYRFRVQDNLPEHFGGPHVVYYPDDRWMTLKVASEGTPLREQEIVGQRDEINKRLDAIKANLLREQRGLNKVRLESRNSQSLDADQVRDLKQLQQDNRSTENALRDLARESDANPALARLGEQARNLANREMRQSDEALRNTADPMTQPSQREEQFDTAGKALSAALEQMEQLRMANEQLAQERLEQQKLETLADRQKQLAERADPSVKQEAELLKREQADLAAELQRLREDTEEHRKALDEARAEKAKELSDKAKKMAATQRELAKAPPEKGQAAQQELLEQSKQLAEDLLRLSQQMERMPDAAKSAKEAAQQAEKAEKEMQQARDQHDKDNRDAAQQSQEEAALALDRAAQQAAQAAAQQMANKQSNEPVQQAQNQMNDAQNKLNQGQRDGAQAAMKLAAESLQKAAQQLASQQSGPPTNPGASGQGTPDPSIFGPDLEKYAGKSWGELPGELRTKLIQDMKAKYGDDYARMIKLYFEQLADTKLK